MKAWLMATRPKTLPAAVVPVWVGCELAYFLTGRLDFFLAVMTLLGAVAIQIATNFFNDAIDAEKGADTEKRLGPVRVTASGLISKKAVYASGVFFLAMAVVCGWFLIEARGWVMLAIGLPSLFLAYGYTGGPWPLAYRGMGEVFVILFFGLIAVGGTAFVQMGEWPWESVLLGLQIGLLSAALIAVNNLRDVEEDTLSGKKTLAVRWGMGVMKWVILICLLLPYDLAFVGCFLGWYPWLMVGWVMVLALPLGGWISWQIFFNKKADLNRMLAMSALHLILFAIAVGISL